MFLHLTYTYKVSVNNNFYEIITNAYANEVIPRNGLPDCQRKSWPFLKVK